MKKKMRVVLAVTLVGAMFMGLNLTAFAADGVEATSPTVGTATVTQEGDHWLSANDDDALEGAVDTDQSQIGVFAKVNISGAAVYKVDIAWGQMKFSYTNSARVWNPTTHSYGDSNEGTVGWETSGYVDASNNKITITNHSNSAITAGLAYANTLTDGKSKFNDAPDVANSVRGHFFEANADAIVAAGVLTNSAIVTNELTTNLSIAACPEGATLEAGTIPNDDVFFTFNGTPDPAATTALPDFNKVGIITVTIGSGV